jgi:hypothetical protein
MAFSLVGFGAGLAESVTERIEEERKFSNLALQGRIERASVLKQQRDKEAAALETELREKKTMLEGWGVQDPNLQKAYLSNPAAFNALQEVNKPGSQIRVDPKDLILSPDKEKLGTMSTDDYITQAVKRLRGPVAPAKLLETPGRGMLAPSAGTEQRRFEQLAGMRGMTLEDVARAEDTTPIQRPPVAAALNVAKLQKPQSAEQQLDAFKGKIISLSTDPAFGPDHPDTKKAVASFKTAKAAIEALTPQELDHSRMLSKSLRIVLDPTLNVSPEERKVAEMYVRNHKRLQDSGEKTDRIPAASALAGLMARAANHAIEAEYGSKVSKDFAMRSVDPSDKDSPKILDYIGDDMTVRRDILRLRQEAAYNMVKAELATGGKIHPNIRFALGAFGIKEFDKNNNPILLPVGKSGDNSKTPRENVDEAVGAATAAPAASTPTPKPATTPKGFPQGSRIARNEFVANRGFKVYNAEGKLIGYAQEE